ncbi:MAG: ABC transporter substrate-binding protein [Phycisphaerae bacterium]|nr:ABC transporter substrate-binding protein [Phycisphaerae bacterium]
MGPIVKRCFVIVGAVLLGLCAAAVVYLVWAAAYRSAQPSQASNHSGNGPERIVSMAPSTTEILFALGVGERVVGVTRFCDYPPETRAITTVGGYADPSYETIVSLRPDLVVLLDSHRDAKAELEKLGIRTLTTPHQTAADVHEAIRRIGAACGAADEADVLLAELGERTEAVRHAVAGLGRPRVFMCIERDTSSAQLAGMVVVGSDGFYNEIIRLAGGVNAYEDATIAYPQLSAEGAIQLNPDVIVDLVARVPPDGPTREQIARQWNRLRTVPAVRRERVHVIVAPYAVRPGPRYVDFLEQLARLLHPEAFSEGVPDG